MSSRAEQLRREADLVEAVDALADVMDVARERYRQDPSDENKAAYRAAVDDLQAARAADRADRPGLTVIAESEV